MSGFDLVGRRFSFFPAGADLVLLSALVAYSGAGGVGNLVLSNWARDKGYGMGARAGYIPAAMGEKVELADTGFRFAPERRSDAPLARVVAHRPRRSVGRVRVRRDARDAVARHCCT